MKLTPAAPKIKSKGEFLDYLINRLNFKIKGYSYCLKKTSLNYFIERHKTPNDFPCTVIATVKNGIYITDEIYCSEKRFLESFVDINEVSYRKFIYNEPEVNSKYVKAKDLEKYIEMMSDDDYLTFTRRNINEIARTAIRMVKAVHYTDRSISLLVSMMDNIENYGHISDDASTEYHKILSEYR